ncbi:MAG: site-specific DNA-methyltransferase [Proteobacteria bacterium]|nr:site-specific DNA-methyltransferase [Pseudomonadota bacterium]
MHLVSNPARPSRPAGDFIEFVERFDGFGAKTEVFEEDGLSYYVNEFWTSRQRQAGRIHEISYRACFKAQLPGFFIAGLSAAGDTVHDPFMGRGTTPIQAAVMGRRAVGVDINPLSVLLTRPRLAPVTPGAVEARLGEISQAGAAAAPDPLDDDLLAFYHPQTLARIKGLREWFARREPADAIDDWIRMVALNRLTGHSPGFFSVYTMPPNQAVSARSQRRINARRGQTPPVRNVTAIIARKSRSLLGGGAHSASHRPDLRCAPAEHTPHLADASVDLVVTSPPFLDIVNYADDNWLRCWFAGIDPAAVPIAMHRSVEAWTAFVREVFGELARVVRPGGHVAFEVGEVRNAKVLLERAVRDAVEGLPFAIEGVVVNLQDFTKTSNCWGVSNNKKGVNTNRIVIMVRK